MYGLTFFNIQEGYQCQKVMGADRDAAAAEGLEEEAHTRADEARMAANEAERERGETRMMFPFLS